MTDQNTPAAEAVGRVAEAIHDAVGGGGAPYRLVGPIESRQAQATAAIQAHTAYLWERWYSDEMSDEFQGFMETMDPDPNEIAEFVLKYLLGPRPEGVRDAK